MTGPTAQRCDVCSEDVEGRVCRNCGWSWVTAAEALFCSDLSPAGQPSGEDVRATAKRAFKALGATECAARMAQAYGDDESRAAERMTWCGEQVKAAYAHASV